MYKHLEPYKRPDYFIDYGTFDRSKYFEVYGRHRGSDLLTNHNYGVIFSRLKALNAPDIGEEDALFDARDSHWAVGWVETIYVHREARELCKLADSLLECLAGYPILDEDAYGLVVHEAVYDRFEGMSEWEKTDLFRDCGLNYEDYEEAMLPEEAYNELREEVEG